MKATIEKPERSILAAEPVVVDFDGRSDRRSVTPNRRAGLDRAVVVAVSALLIMAATFVWATLGDSGAQLVETETASPVTAAPPAEPDSASAQSSVDRDALVVDLDRDDLDSGTESATLTAPTTTPLGRPEPVSNPDSVSTTGSSISASTTAMRSPERALRAGEPSPSGSIGRTGMSSPTSTPTSGSAGSGPTSSSATTSTSTSGTTSTGSASGVAWEEHFNSLDTGRWQIEHSTYGDGNGERQCYQPDNVQVTNGRLVLTARAETTTCPNGSTRTVSSGMVRSRGLTFSPGQSIEFRVKLTPPDPSNQAGLWPAVWASSWAGSWPRGGELDFLEVMTAEDPRRAVFSVHYADRSGGHELQNRGVPLPGYFSDGWHTIRFDYGPNGRLAWFLDGSTVFSVSAAETAQGYPAPFDQTIHEIKLNLAIGGSPGPLASGALGSTGATFEIDYIRVIDL